MLLTVPSNVTAVRRGPVCILMDRIGQRTELEGDFANLGLTRYNEV